MAKKFTVSTILPATPQEVYAAWLDPKRHGKMTGSKARGGSKVGDTFDAWDGYISGTHLELKPGKKIVQSWRTVEFSDDEEDSHLVIEFAAVKGGAKVTITHSKLPAHGNQYKQGWVDSYFNPMADFFGK